MSLLRKITILAHMMRVINTCAEKCNFLLDVESVHRSRDLSAHVQYEFDSCTFVFLPKLPRRFHLKREKLIYEALYSCKGR